MARYIDADALIEEINKITKEFEDKPVIPSVFASIAVIQNQPTAYDPDAVAADIEDFREEAEQFGFASALSDIVEVVRKGGVE